MQGVRGLEHLRAREGAKRVQGVRGLEICEHRRQRHRCKECRSAREAATRVLCPPVHPETEILVEPEDVEDPGEEV